jgi:hypothetical protein
MVLQAKLIALLANPNNFAAERMVRDVQEAAHAKGVQLHILKSGAEHEFETAFAFLARSHAGALLVGNDPFFFAGAKSWWLWRQAMPFQRCMKCVNSPRRAAWSAMEPASRCLSPGRHLRRQDPEGRPAGRSAGPAPDHLRAGDQSQDSEGARPDRAAIDPRPSRRSDRMSASGGQMTCSGNQPEKSSFRLGSTAAV